MSRQRRSITHHLSQEVSNTKLYDPTTISYNVPDHYSYEQCIKAFAVFTVLVPPESAYHTIPET